jgi:hypothetical protein
MPSNEPATNDDNSDRPGTKHDDDLSKRTHIGGVPFSDMAAFSEDTRIMAIGNAGRRSTKGVGALVESDAVEGCQGKADRYIRKIKARFPDLIVTKHDGLTPLTTIIKVSPTSAKVSKADFLKG